MYKISSDYSRPLTQCGGSITALPSASITKPQAPSKASRVSEQSSQSSLRNHKLSVPNEQMDCLAQPGIHSDGRLCAVQNYPMPGFVTAMDFTRISRKRTGDQSSKPARRKGKPTGLSPIERRSVSCMLLVNARAGSAGCYPCCRSCSNDR